ncbi:MAG: SEC-C metal-binding domain-containing protein [Acidimicrobiia bacterium]
MDLDRAKLGRIDRRLMAGLDQDETFRMGGVPVTEAQWSTWKRYCGAAGISMGRAITTLIERELVSILRESTGKGPPVLAERAEEQLTARAAQLAARERAAEANEERLRGWNDRLRLWHGELKVLEQRTEVAPIQAPRPIETASKVGRNERCPCGSGLKYKHCHGLAGRRPGSA